MLPVVKETCSGFKIHSMENKQISSWYSDAIFGIPLRYIHVKKQKTKEPNLYRMKSEHSGVRQ